MTRLRFFGVNSNTGIGIHCQNVMHAIQALQIKGLEVEFYSYENIKDIEASVESSKDEDVNVFFQPINFLITLKGLKLFWCVFESSRPPESILAFDKHVDYFISPSGWGRNCLINYGIKSDKVVVIPEGVDPIMYHPYNRVQKINNVKKILMLGKYESRKGYAEALEAFAIAYDKRKDIELWVKPDWIVGGSSQIPNEFINLCQKYANLPIVVVKGNLGIEEIKNLYNEADIFLFPSRCEGWGLPLIEALASGVPTICCDYGGQEEYLRNINKYIYKIPYKLNRIDCDIYKRHYPSGDNDFGMWANFESNDISKLILGILETPQQKLKNYAENASSIIRYKYSWCMAAENIYKTIARLISPP